MATTDRAPHQEPIFVEVSRASFRHILELEAGTERAYLVGASQQADVFIDAPGAAAVEFHLERLGSDIWLTPAYRGRRILVNGAPVLDRVPITSGVLLRLGDYELGVRLLNPDEPREASTRSSSAPRPLPNDYSLGLPTDTQQTSLAMTPQLPEAADAAINGGWRGARAHLSEHRTERLRPVAAPSLLPQQTERMAPVVIPPQLASGLGQTETVRMKPIAVPPPKTSPVLASHGPVSASATGLVVPSSPLASQETSSFDIARLSPVPTPVPEPPPPPEPARPAPKGAEVPKVPSHAPRATSSLQLLLAQLGVMTQRRPVLIAGMALAGSLVLALALVGASRLSPSRSVPVSPPTTKVTARSATPGPTLPTPTDAPPAILVAPAPSSAATPVASGAEKPSEAAARNLSAGRLAEAAEQYRLLGMQPDGAVYAEVAALLSRRLSANCATKASPTRGCPEILK